MRVPEKAKKGVACRGDGQSTSEKGDRKTNGKDALRSQTVGYELENAFHEETPKS